MKTRFLLLSILLLTLCWNYSKAQWTSLGSGVSAANHKVWGIEAVDENIIWAVSYNYQTFVKPEYLIKSNNGGNTWTTLQIDDTPASQYPLHIYPLGENLAWLATSDELNPISGRIYKTTDGGQSWVHQGTAFSGFNETPAGVYFWNENEGVAFGATHLTTGTNQISVYRTENGGALWTKVVAPNFPTQLAGEGLIIHNDNGWFDVRGDYVWFQTNGSRIYRSADRGISWTAHVTGLNDVSGLAFKDSLNGIVVNYSPNAGARTSDGGLTWTPITPWPSTPATTEIAYVPGTKGTYVLHASTIGSAASVLVSYNDGSTWEILTTTPNLECLEFNSPTLGFAGGFITNATTGGIYKWSGPALGNRLFVNDDATGANTGYNWADAFTDLQSALAIAEEGDQIWVAEGTYKPGSDPTATFLIDKNLQLYGGFAGTEASLAERGDPAEHPTILSGDVNGDDVPGNFLISRNDNSSHVVSIDEVANGTLLDGFTISGGNGKPTTPPAGNDISPERGGGVASLASCSIKNCIFWDNSAVWGGAGCYARFGDEVLFENCTFEGNNASRGALNLAFCHDAQILNCQFTGNTASFGGAGLNLGNSNAVIRDCEFTNNQTPGGDAGALFLWHNPQIEFENPSMAIENCTFTGNHANWGGGISFNHFIPGGHLEVQGCSFANNTATSDGGGLSVYNANSGSELLSVTLTNNDFTNNASSGDGGGVYLYNLGGALIDSCSAIGNQAARGGGMYLQNSNTQTTNCFFQFNSAATGGGGMYCDILPNIANNDTEINGCTFLENTSSVHTAALEIRNQGSNSSFKVDDCTFRKNVGDGEGTTTIYCTSGGSTVGEVSNCLFDENRTYLGGAMQLGNTNTPGSSFEVVLFNNVFTNNEAEMDGAIDFISGIQTHFKAEMDNCHFEGNKSFTSGSAFGILAHDEDFEINVRNCTILDNEGTEGGVINGLRVFGGPILVNASVSFENTLFSGNSGDAVFSHNGIGALNLLNCTVADNPTKGVQLSNSATLKIQNTILANPGHTEYTASTNSTFTSNGGNLVLDNSLNANLTPQDKPETEPAFEPGTYEPSATSPLVNGGVNTGVTALYDIAGNERIQQGTVDIGAYESPYDIVSTREIIVGEIGLAPNPATDLLYPHLPATARPTHFDIFDAQGRLVQTGTFAEGENLRVGHLPGGVFTLKMTDGERVYVGRFVKQ